MKSYLMVEKLPNSFVFLLAEQKSSKSKQEVFTPGLPDDKHVSHVIVTRPMACCALLSWGKEEDCVALLPLTPSGQRKKI